jgi:MtaA/CmuA family methyltransferase
MTSLQRCRAVLEGEVPDRVPVIPQTFMFACETAGFRISDINKNGRLMAETHRVSREKYGYDGCVIDIDDASLAEACGAKVIFRDEEVAIVDEHEAVLKDLRDIEDMDLPDPRKDGRLPEWLAATEELVGAIGDHVFIMGRADQGPFDLACLLRGTETFMMDLITADPKEIWAVLDWCREANLRFSKAQKDAGAHATSIGDSYAGPSLMSPEMFRRFALEHEITLTRQVQEYGIPFSIHICGNTNEILRDMVSTGAKILEVDWQVDMKEAAKICRDKTVLMGNINPSDPLVFGTPEVVDAQAKAIIEGCRGRGLFLSSGCAMGRNTRPENMEALVSAAKKYGRYEQIMEMSTENEEEE